MKLFTKSVLFIATLLQGTKAFELPTCGTENCLTDNLFYGCKPKVLGCICKMDQGRVDEFVGNITPCLKSSDRKKKYCTDGALFQYISLLKDVCKDFGKNVDLEYESVVEGN
ncbi:hypothetical protein BCR34DRAFT_590359 [Clohesyomyces aquaticus]|uniref:Extracellular membrane protein CFEM domain-containing protein n=1 Tax=Clohesyomyces aquaticus TaxID=1231657 RepID=A0A1Y1ZAI5_9PLEO|nr:hypothetical protein BCR34DRAFT_590359 [Clohesyomyces aquaticus]